MAKTVTAVRFTHDHKMGNVTYRKGFVAKVVSTIAKQLVLKKRVAEYVEVDPMEFKKVPRNARGVQVIPGVEARKHATAQAKKAKAKAKKEADKAKAE